MILHWRDWVHVCLVFFSSLSLTGSGVNIVLFFTKNVFCVLGSGCSAKLKICFSSEVSIQKPSESSRKRQSALCFSQTCQRWFFFFFFWYWHFLGVCTIVSVRVHSRNTGCGCAEERWVCRGVSQYTWQCVSCCQVWAWCGTPGRWVSLAGYEWSASQIPSILSGYKE